MKKVALVVKSEFWTRVIVEVPDSFDENTMEEVSLNMEATFDVLDKTTEKLIEQLQNEELADNINEVVIDHELPYSPDYDN